MTTDDGFYFGRYYKVPAEDNGVFLGMRPFHSYFCGHINDEFDLYFFHFYTGDMPDTKGVNQEAFDYAPMATDPIKNLPLFSTALEDGVLEYPAEDMLGNLPASSAQIAWQMINAGMSTSELVTTQAGILIEDCLGETFEEVIYEHPEYLVSTITTDEFGVEQTTYNIWEVKFR